MASAPRTLRELSDHPAVHVVENETDTQDGYWVYLKPGYVWDGTTSHVHEPTVKACCEAMADVRWDPIAWGHACGASDDEVVQLRGSFVTHLEDMPRGAGVAAFRDSGGLSHGGRVVFPDTYSHCGAAACLDAAGFTLSPKVAALSRRWADLGQKPNPEGVAMVREILGA
jgi:hypothetical protein|tara:strand:+ start:124 stop:633 length:510 start_codon:yes stop_codon:yes gene_type:complete